MNPAVVSVIICSCNRAEHLRQTLASLAAVHVPESMPAELIVVDNGSTDSTAEVVRQCRLSNIAVRSVFEPKRGLSQARNSGLAAAQGDIFLFTDDDLRFPVDWIAGMCEPILAGRAEAVAGGVVLAPHLRRDWMEQQHQSWVASTGNVAAEEQVRMVGANMAFARRVLEKIPQFDPELGAGAMGFGEETLFTFQLVQAGFRLELALEVSVEHHFEENRLSRANFLSTAQKIGRSEAYVGYHWKHQPSVPVQRRLRQGLRQLYWRFRRGWAAGPSEGMPLWEMNLLRFIAFDQQMLIEGERPRQYEKFGLVKTRERAE